MGRYADNLKEQKAAQEADQKYVDTTEIGEAIEAALGEEGTITSAISAAITAAIGDGGAIETWADGRYEAKSV